MEKVKNKNADISVMRLIDTLGVLFIHTCNTVINNEKLFSPNYYQYTVCSCGYKLMEWFVPLFFMITGALLLNTERIINVNVCIFKYCKRILAALLIFGVPMSWLEIVLATRSLSIGVIFEGFKNILTGDSWGHLWYLYELIGIYLLLPLIKSFVSFNDRNEYRKYIFIVFIMNLVIPLFEKSMKIDIRFSMGGIASFTC